MARSEVKTVLVGRIVHSRSLSELEVIEHGVLGVTFDGKIAFREVIDGDASNSESEQLVKETLTRLSQEYGFPQRAVRRLTADQFLLPGFIDTHIHAPQYVYTGTGYDLPLMDWLEKYTFPREKAFSDPEYARTAYTKAVTRCLRSGTTTAAYYATIHNEATKILAHIISDLGQRAFVGKVCMDRNSPQWYTETTEDSLRDTKDIADYIANLSPDRRVQPILTPRFVATCTSELMNGLAELAKERDFPIQTHLSESPAEIDFVAQLHPASESYTAVYAEHGLLTNKTVLAHCVHLSESERRLVHDHDAGIAHCPNSNFSLLSGVMSVRKLLQEGIKVGLGTDVAGGYSTSMIDAMRQAIIASKVVFCETRKAEANGSKPLQPLTLSEVLFLATLGGAQVLGLDSVGNFDVGKDFDALLVDLSSERGTIDLFPHDTTLDAIEKFVYNGDDRNIANVWVGGRLVL
ncbi:hypothetical protein HDV00_003817 [Rhizophlyctis rosea]|nr:hypothetical protein HDV00_003817 [Rhizophlyctis rosea]